MSLILSKNNTDYNLGRGSYNDFFQFFEKPNSLKMIGLHSLLSKIFPMEDKNKDIKIKYNGYSVDLGTYNEEIYSSRYLSYTGKIKILLEIEIKNKKIEHIFSVNHVPIMVQNMYYMINGTKKIMIYQLLKIGGIYVDIDSNSRVNNVKLTSVSGSRIELKLNQKETINIYVNNSKKILIYEFFNLIDYEKLNRFIKHYKSKRIQSLFSSNIENKIKYMMLFGNVFSVQIHKNKVVIFCEEQEHSKYLFSKWKKFVFVNDYVEISLDNLYGNFFLFFDNSLNTKYLFDIKEGSYFSENLKKQIQSSFNENDFVNAELLFFMNNQEIICRSFANIIDKSDLTEEDETSTDNFENEEEVLEKDDEDECLEENVSSESVSVDEFEENVEEENSALSIEYQIDKVIRSRINKILKIEYSTLSERFTEEDIIKFICYFGELVNKVKTEKQNYDFLFYKKVKRPEDFISNIILKKINKLKNNLKYISLNETNNNTNLEDFLNSYNSSNEIRKLFSSHPLVQFLDQTNPLAELSHRRRISVFNLVNTEKYQVSFEGRDINPTYYGRICPVETPEGSNIGLINSISVNAQIDEYGFLIVPYYIVVDGKLTDEIIYINSEKEYSSKVTYLNKFHKHDSKCLIRYKNDIYSGLFSEVEYMDITSNTILSLASSLIPFIQNDDARRALMGSNMQRQAVPLVRAEAPIVGTGIENMLVDINNNSIIADRDVNILYSCSEFIIYSNIKDLNDDISVKEIIKYNKTNMRTCGNSSVKVFNNQFYKKNEILVDGFSSQNGELSIGQNVLVAFLSWYGYSFEDSIVVSDRLICNGYFESIHINEIDVKAKEIDVEVIEKITLDNPNDEIRKMTHLDERGIVKVGSKIKPCQILVSRVVPIQGEMSIEDNVLSIIFGKDISDFKDISYKSTYDIKGTVIDVKYFNRSIETADQDFISVIKEKSINIQRKICQSIIYKCSKFISVTEKDLNDLIFKINKSDENEFDKILSSFISDYISEEDEIVEKFILKNKLKIDLIKNYYNKIIIENRSLNIENNVIEYVRILVANRRTINIGDKVSGRHGNKGVVSHICPVQDMPFMDDGTPIDILLNPVGIPNRLNIGQVMEIYLGLSSYMLNKKIKFLIKTNNVDKAKELLKFYLSSKCNRNKNLNIDQAINKIVNNNQYIVLEAPAFDSISIDEIKNLLKQLDVPECGLFRLRCGITGNYMNRKVQVGFKYIMKLNHMSIDKISARETGGYSTILQQPLPRKANYGGQRFGEMEAWAVEAYGASNVIREILTVKSDDIVGRNKLYESILNCEYKYSVHLPEIVNVITRYLNGACIKLDFLKKK